MIHNTLPTKSKIWNRKTTENQYNYSHNKHTTYWQNKYKYVKDNICSMCTTEEENTAHIICCSHPLIRNICNKMNAKLELLINTDKPWYLTHPKALANQPDDHLSDGSRGLMPKWLVDSLKPEDNSDMTPYTIISSAQKYIIKAHLKAWRTRNTILFSSNIT